MKRLFLTILILTVIIINPNSFAYASWPSSHPAGAFYASIELFEDIDILEYKFDLYIWEESGECWVEIVPISMGISISATQFTVIQGGIQNSSLRFETSNGAPPGLSYYIPTVLKIAYLPYMSPYEIDLSKPFTLIYDLGGGDLVTMNVPALMGGTTPDPDPASTTILSNESPNHTIASGSDEQVYGTSASNQITLESGAKAELINFPGQNVIEILATSEGFTVSRSGTIVTFQDGNGTLLKIPATQAAQIIDFTDRSSLTLSIHNGQVLLDDQVVTATVAAIFDESGLTGPCGAYVAPNVWKEFDCYNLAAIGKTTGDDPSTPSWRLIGGYWKWGRKGPDSSQWYDTNTEYFVHGPTGPGENETNDGIINGWDQTDAPDGSWSDSEKTANDPCPAGYRVPTESQWDGVIANNTQSTVGTWSDSATNYSSARFFGIDLMLPAAGCRSYHGGPLRYRGFYGYFWSSSEFSSTTAWSLRFRGGDAHTHFANYRRYGFSVRCISE